MQSPVSSGTEISKLISLPSVTVRSRAPIVISAVSSSVITILLMRHSNLMRSSSPLRNSETSKYSLSSIWLLSTILILTVVSRSPALITQRASCVRIYIVIPASCAFLLIDEHYGVVEPCRPYPARLDDRFCAAYVFGHHQVFAAIFPADLDSVCPVIEVSLPCGADLVGPVAKHRRLQCFLPRCRSLCSARCRGPSYVL